MTRDCAATLRRCPRCGGERESRRCRGCHRIYMRAWRRRHVLREAIPISVVLSGFLAEAA